MLGGAGSDTLRGGPGADTMKGNAGVDAANGGSDLDICETEVVKACEVFTSRGQRATS